MPLKRYQERAVNEVKIFLDLLAAEQALHLVEARVGRRGTDAELVTDARAAWTLAKKQGYIGSPQSGSGAHAEKLAIANNCPRRWLVVLHLELNPQLGGSI